MDHIAPLEADLAISRIKGLACGSPSASEVQRFCDRLRGYTWRNYRETIAEPDLTPLPVGYRNFRVVDGRDRAVLGETFWLNSNHATTRAHVDRVGRTSNVVHRQPTVRSVVATVRSGFVFEEIDEWSSISVAPCDEPGMLELVVEIRTRVRALMPNGEPFQRHVRDFFALKAPPRARLGAPR